MSTSTIEHLNCIILPFAETLYLLPMLAIAEFLPLESYRSVSKVRNAVGQLTWHQQPIPIITLNLKPLDITQTCDGKIAVIKANAGTQTNAFYFGVIFEGSPKKISITETMLSWEDEKMRIANLAHSHHLQQVKLLDVQQLLTQIEKDNVG